MKIGVNSRVYQQAGSGIPYYIKNLYSKLQQIDKKNSYVFFQTDNKKVIGKTEIIKTKKTGVSGAFFDLFFVNKLIRKQRINVFHGTSFMLPFFRSRGVKYIVTIHDLAFLALRREPNDYSFLYYLFTKYGIMRSLKVADVVVADSKNTKRDIIKYYRTPAKKIKVVYLGVNERFLTSSGRSRRIIKEKYFFSVTTNPKRKNILSVLEAMAGSKKLSGYTYVIAGLISERQTQKLNCEIEKYGLKDRVKIFGYATENELKNLYQNAEFFIYPSFYEGFGFPVVEAMACNCPVITSNKSSLIELMPDKQWLVNPYKVLDIRNKMEQMIELTKKRRDALVKSNYLFAKRFNWERTAKEMIDLFKQFHNE